MRPLSAPSPPGRWRLGGVPALGIPGDRNPRGMPCSLRDGPSLPSRREQDLPLRSMAP
jgi:hypothetical protein